MVIILHRELRDLHLTLDKQHLLGIPARIYGSLLGWFSWHYSRALTVPITSTPAKDLATSEHWATACHNALCVVDLRQPAAKSRTTEESSMELALSQSPALRGIHATLAAHCGASTAALQTQLNRQNFRRDFSLDDTPLPAPADNSIGRHQDACCSICTRTSEDAWGEADGRDDHLLQVWNCGACAQWFHDECLSEEARASLPEHAMTEEELDTSPGWRCPECVEGKRFAINRILEIVRTEAGRYRLVLDYIGYPYYECELPALLTDKKMALGADALTEAYQRHELQRTHRSLLFCAIALLDAMDQTGPLKQLGLHLKLVHNDPRFYLISHRSLGQRGLNTAEASTYNMLAPDHRLFLPFSLQQLLVDPSGKALPDMTGGPTSSPYAAATHLEALTTNSLVLALAHAIVADGPWDSLGLLSGSCLADIITALDEFCSRYDRHRWQIILCEAIPGLTEQDVDWLSSLHVSLNGPLPPPLPFYCTAQTQA